MAHSTGETGHLDREKGEVFGDSKYAREELVAELTSASCGKTMGISTCIREENAMYLKSWLSALSQDPKFIYTILSDVAKASGMIQEKVNAMEPKLTNDEKFLLAASQGNEGKLKELKDAGYSPSLLMIDRLNINVSSNESKEAVGKVFGIDVETSRTADLTKEMARSAEMTMNI